MFLLKRISIVFVIAFLLLPQGKIHAQDGAGFSISPPAFELNANPGDSLPNSIKVTNVSSTPLTLSVKSENFVAYGEGGQVALTEEESTYSISKWLSWTEGTFTVQPKDTYLFNFKLDIPVNAEPGSHYGAVVFSTGGTSASGSNVAIMQEIGSLILIKIPGDVVEEGVMANFAPSQSTYQENDIQLTALVENVGSVHFKPSGFIYIRDIFGNKIETIEVKGRNILPGSKRLFEESFKLYKFGYFKAEIELFYQDGQKVIRGETNFFSLDKDRSLPITIGGIGIIALYFLLRKRINKALAVIIKG